MDSLLKNCIAVEQSTIERFLLAEGVKPAEIHCRMLAE